MIRVEKKKPNEFVLHLDLGYPNGEFLGKGLELWDAAISLCYSICETVWAPLYTLTTLKAWYPKKELDLVQCHILNACKTAEEADLGVTFRFETSPNTEKQIPFCGGEGLPEIMRMFKAGYPLSVVHTSHSNDSKRVFTQYCPKRLNEKANFYMMVNDKDTKGTIIGQGKDMYAMQKAFLYDMHCLIFNELGERMEITEDVGH